MACTGIHPPLTHKMTSVATFELKTALTMPTVKKEASQHWHGTGYRVDICSWWPDQPNRILCVLEYFYHYSDLELEMLVATADYLISIAQNADVYYYRCIDFVSDKDPDRSAYKTGESLEILNSNDLRKSEYHPSMSAWNIYLLRS
jgi:hypothetical protein